MKKTIFFYLLLVPIFSIGQSDPQTDFKKTRQTDFTKLLGIQTSFEGIKLNYNTEKSYVEGSIGKALGSGKFLLQGGGTFGTTTNLSALFDQKLLPTFSFNLGINMLLKGSVWYYDSTFTNNYPNIQNDAIPIESINTQYHFVYREKLREDVNGGKHPVTKKLYTAKKLFWLSLTGKYENSKYSFFDDKRAFAKQIYDTTYSSLGAKFNVNFYRFWNKEDTRWTRIRPNFYFITVYVKYDLSNNISKLKKVTVNDVSQSIPSPNPPTVREVTKSQSSYTGGYNEFHSINPGFEFLYSPFNSVALDIFGDINLIPKSQRATAAVDNYGSFGGGLFFYSNSGNAASKINIGVFYKWVDKSQNNWKGEFGIKTSIPITP